GAVLDRVAHRDEDVFDLLSEQRYRMKMTLSRTRTRERDVYCFAAERVRFGLRGESLSESGELGFHVGGDLVHLPTKGRALIGRDRTDSFLFRGQQPCLSAKVLVPEGGELFRVCDAGRLFEELKTQLCQFIVHAH